MWQVKIFWSENTAPVVRNYCIWYNGICLSSLAKKVEQRDGQIDGGRDRHLR